MSREINPFGLRMPADLREAMEGAAKVNGRSLNAEIVQRLRDSLAHREKESGAGKRSELLQGAIILGDDLLNSSKRKRTSKQKAAIYDTIYDLLVMYEDKETVKEKMKNVIFMEENKENETS